VHVFAGQFDDIEAAVVYTEEQWEPEPDQAASGEEYSAWEARNPSWKMVEDLVGPGHYFDHDFIETLMDPDRYEYLGKLINDEDSLAQIRVTAGVSANTLVLIFPGAFGGMDAKMKSTPQVTYCGEYPASFDLLR
jgi:hypothetical protein